MGDYANLRDKFRLGSILSFLWSELIEDEELIGEYQPDTCSIIDKQLKFDFGDHFDSFTHDVVFNSNTISLEDNKSKILGRRLAIIVGQSSDDPSFLVLICDGLVEEYHISELELHFNKEFDLPIFEYNYTNKNRLEIDYIEGIFDPYLSYYKQQAGIS